jgi:hypothetical protein
VKLSKKTVRVVAVIAPLLAITPFVIGKTEGAWIALHLIGGATALAVLIYCAWHLPKRQRVIACAGVVISIAVISIITGGGTLGPAVQVVMLAVLGAIYVFSVAKADL